MTHACRGIFIVGAKRTPFCKYGSYFKNLPASQIFAAAAKDAIHSANLEVSLIDSTVVGNVHYLSQCDGNKTSRYCGLYSGIPIDKPAFGVNKICGSGLQALINGALEIMTGSAKTCLVGGTEAMSALPLLVRDIRFGSKLGSEYILEDPLSVEIDINCRMGRLAEDVAEGLNLSREECDQYTLDSHLKFKKAQQAGVFTNEITGLKGGKNQEVDVAIDEIPMTELTRENLTKSPTLLKNGKITTVANSSAPADGAAAVVLADEDSVLRHNLTPLARLAGWACVGCGDKEYGLEDTVAINRLLKVLNLTPEQLDFIEVNERYASQSIAAVRRLKVDAAIVNSCGGSLAIGNPTAATGTRMAVHIAHRLSGQTTGKAIAATSCGIGQGIAILLEKP